ncbi:MAG: hypothetical protein WEB19_01590 [Acidimicrobiia bacterium]
MPDIEQEQQRADESTEDVGRRRFLRRGAITAAVAAAGAAAFARPAAAANDDAVMIGAGQDANNVGTTTTTLTGSQFAAVNGNGGISLVGEHATLNAVGIEGRAANGTQLRLAPNNVDIATGTDTTHVFDSGSIVNDVNDLVWVSLGDGATAENNGMHPISLTSAFVPISPPVRVYDSRLTGGPLNGSAQQERIVNILVGNSIAIAFMVNLTVVNTTGSGFLAMFAADEVWNPLAPFSSINWFTTGQIAANGVAGTAEFSTGNIKVRAGGAGATDFVLDVTGVWII